LASGLSNSETLGASRKIIRNICPNRRWANTQNLAIWLLGKAVSAVGITQWHDKKHCKVANKKADKVDNR